MNVRDDEALREHYADHSMPPHVLPSERAVLGAMLVKGAQVAHSLRREDFYRDWHGELFTVLTDLYAAHPAMDYLDPVAVKDELFRRRWHDRATEMFLIYDEGVYLSVAAPYHVERILESAEARLVQQFGQTLATMGSSSRVDTVLADLRSAVASVRARAGHEDQMASTQLDELVRLNKLRAATQTVPAMSTGLVDLDKLLNGGLRPSTFNVLGARPGVGKSLLAGAVALHLGSTGLHRVLYVTLELTAAEVTNRMLSNLANVELTRLQNPGLLDDNDWYRYSDAEERLAGWPIHIEEGAKSIGQIEDVARNYLGSAPSGLLVVDYLGRIREDGTAASRERHVALCASRLTDLAHELKVPVLCVVSFSRDSVKRGGPPRMDDIRDSGNVESDADTVMLLWQPKADDAGSVELIVDKNRYGPESSVMLNKQGHRGRLVSAARSGWTP